MQCYLSDFCILFLLIPGAPGSILYVSTRRRENKVPEAVSAAWQIFGKLFSNPTPLREVTTGTSMNRTKQKQGQGLLAHIWAKPKGEKLPENARRIRDFWGDIFPIPLEYKWTSFLANIKQRLGLISFSLSPDNKKNVKVHSFYS